MLKCVAGGKPSYKFRWSQLAKIQPEMSLRVFSKEQANDFEVKI